MSKPIELTLSVNNKTEKFGFRFSLSLERIERLIEKTPDLVQEAFTPAHTPSQVIANQLEAKSYILGTGSAIIAKAIKPEKVKVVKAMIEEALAAE